MISKRHKAFKMNTLKNRILAAACLGVLAVNLASSARADINLVLNGDFETTTHGGGQLGYNTQAAFWTTGGYNFLFTPGSADSTGVTGSDGNLKLWGPSDGSANGLPSTSPSGGNYVAADGAYEVGAISQTVSNLFVGNTYSLSFYWAGAQQSGFSGTNTEAWQVSLGTETYTTDIATNVSHGFTGWVQQTFNFTATATNEVLSVLARGTPPGVPPFSVLDGVSMTQVTSPTPAPEPSTLQYGAVALLFVCAGARKMFRRKTQA